MPRPLRHSWLQSLNICVVLTSTLLSLNLSFFRFLVYCVGPYFEKYVSRVGGSFSTQLDLSFDVAIGLATRVGKGDIAEVAG